MYAMFAFVLFCAFTSCYATLRTEDDESYSNGRAREMEKCGPVATGIDWIIAQRNEDYGWGLQTHRAIIAVLIGLREGRTVLNNPDEEVLMMNQLEVELSVALLRNKTGLTMPQSELSLFIHALLVVGLNPRSFKGIDLVEILERKMEDENSSSHPFTALCLCNAGVLKRRHLMRISMFLEPNSNPGTSAIELMAITLKAFACAEPDMVMDFKVKMNKTADFLLNLQKEDDSFGNPFTTSMVVQALKAMNLAQLANDALHFLRDQQSSHLVEIYYIEMALQKKVFIKDYIQNMPIPREEEKRKREVFVKYSLKVGYLPDSYITISLHMPKYSTMLDVMKFASKENFQFEFLHGLLKNNDPMIYSISGLPNNAEDGLYWRLYRALKNDNDLNTRLEELTEPVNKIPVLNDGEYIFQYRDLFEFA